MARSLNIQDPNDGVKALRKVQGDLRDGVPALMWWDGQVYSRVPGEKDTLLFAINGMNVRTTKTLSDEPYSYKMFSKEVLLYLDPTSGEVLHEWRNPLTGKTCQVVHIANDPVNFTIPYPGREFTFPGQVVKNRLLLRSMFPLLYPNPLGGDYQTYVGGQYQAMEMFSTFADATKVLDPSTTSATNVDIGWTRVCQWLPWMEMGDRAGCLMFHGSGTRLDSFEELPPVLKGAIELHYPTFKTPPPLDDERPNMTSWKYFKKLKSGEIEDPWKKQ